MAKPWNEIEHKATPEQLEKAREQQEEEIRAYRLRHLHIELWESAKLWWQEGKLGLALAAAFIIAVILFVWLG